MVAWSDRGPGDEFQGTLSDPMPVTVGPGGRLIVAVPALLDADRDAIR